MASLNASQLGVSRGAGDSGYQGTNPMAERASLFGPGAL